LTAFKDIANQSITQLSDSFENNDIVGIRRIAHKIKPSVANLQINSILDKVAQLEKFDLDANSSCGLKILVDDVSKILRRVVEDIELVYLL